MVHGRDVFNGHEAELFFDPLLLNAILHLELGSSLNLSPGSSDFGIGHRLGPLTSCVCLSLAGGDLEFDEGLEAAKKPLLDELGEDDAKLASLGVDLLSQAVGESQKDLLEFKEDDLNSLDKDEMLSDHLLAPVNL